MLADLIAPFVASSWFPWVWLSGCIPVAIGMIWGTLYWATRETAQDIYGVCEPAEEMEPGASATLEPAPVLVVAVVPAELVDRAAR